jgi:hypothetical protein
VDHCRSPTFCGARARSSPVMATGGTMASCRLTRFGRPSCTHRHDGPPRYHSLQRMHLGGVAGHSDVNEPPAQPSSVA